MGKEGVKSGVEFKAGMLGLKESVLAGEEATLPPSPETEVQNGNAGGGPADGGSGGAAAGGLLQAPAGEGDLGKRTPPEVEREGRIREKVALGLSREEAETLVSDEMGRRG
jgi:hypothetical protein